MKYKINFVASIVSLFTLFTFSQEIQREVISSQGESVELDSGIYVTQTIGQHSVASYSINNLTVQQGYQQSFWNSLINSNEEFNMDITFYPNPTICLLYTSPSPRDATLSRMPSSA